ncbi:serine hydrolase domain-containing protein [Streptomyces phaeofaciens]|uniref:serine hydrolase domain-containing protein n=1 Tax=Streptomyces phaeofaciens TaxID=68254 RepID=UPI00369E95B1
MRVNRFVGAVLGASLLLAAGVQAASADGPASAATATRTLDRTALRATLDGIRDAGMYGTYSSVRGGGSAWTGASGVADVDTRRPVRPGMRHRVGSITKTFTAVAVLQQVERGRIVLDAPVGDYLPGLVPGERGRIVTVRMLLNHTSGIGDYVLGAFPSLARNSTESIDEGRFRHLRPEKLVRLGLAAPATGRPGAAWSYSNTNYAIAGLILEKVTGQDAGTYLTRHVVARAGLRHTTYPRTPYLSGPHSRMYESYFGVIDPPRDYSVYDMSWGNTAGALVSTTDDLNLFYRSLLGGELIGRAALTEMLRTVPGADGLDHGLGIDALDLPDCGRFWGHDGAVFGAGTIALSSRDGRHQVALGWNMTKYQRVGDDGTFEPSPIDDALYGHLTQALCPTTAEPPAEPGTGTADARRAFPDRPLGIDLSPAGRVAPTRWARALTPAF